MSFPIAFQQQVRHPIREANAAAIGQVRMSLTQVGVLLLLALVVGAGGALVFEGNISPVSVRLGSFTTNDARSGS
jgi:hypothetical protein